MNSKGKRTAMVVAAGGLVLSSSAAQAARWYVDASAGAGGDGTSWNTAFNTLTAAINIANANDDIWVADGTYKPASQSSSFTLEAGVEIFGGFSGNETLVTQRNPNPLTNGCVLSGDVDNDNTLDAQNCYHIVKAPATGTMQESDTRLDGFKITMGYADGAGDIEAGGGILLDNGPLIRNCWITDNFAADYGGGGVCVDAGSNAPVFRHCIIQDNSTTNTLGGGGVIVYDGLLPNSSTTSSTTTPLPPAAASAPSTPPP